MTNDRADPSPKSDDLSQSARAVVHDAGDPRIDAHLRALGLAPEPDEPAMEATRAEPARSPELVALSTRVAELDAALAASRRRARQLAVALGVAVVAVVILALLLAVRPG